MGIRREVRTLRLQQDRYVDDRLWPTLLALSSLAAVLAWVSISGDRFDDPRPWANTWVQLLAIAATLGGSVWAVVQSRTKHRFHLSTILSLLAHAALAIFLSFQHLQLDLELAEDAEVAQVNQREEEDLTPKVVVVEPPVADERQPIERPVQSTSPQLKTDPLTRERTPPQNTNTGAEPASGFGTSRGKYASSDTPAKTAAVSGSTRGHDRGSQPSNSRTACHGG